MAYKAIDKLGDTSDAEFRKAKKETKKKRTCANNSCKRTMADI